MSNTNELTAFENLRKIIIHEMGLADDRVNIFNQKWKIPTYDDLFIVLECLPSKIISNRSTVKMVPGEYVEIHDLTVQERITVMVFSRNMDALLRKEEVIMALCSTYSQQIQEQYSFHIARIAPIEDLTMLEGAAQLYRYDIPVIMLTWQTLTKAVEYYDAFTGRIKVNDGAPIITQDFSQPNV